ncbi:hypothetical protein WA158_006323 [Blastocystis sp. Blastoise]
MFCAISGQVPEEPVVNKKTGHLYEKRLIYKYIESEGKDPITGEELTKDDLLEVQSAQAVKPRPITATSIPGLLSLLQNEYDSVMLESFTVKKHYQELRQELSQALYQHEAACRVIARLIKERDAAREALAAVQNMPVSVPQEVAAETEEKKISEAQLAMMSKKATELFKGRKNKRKNAKYPEVDILGKFEVQESYSPHQSTAPIVNSISLSPSSTDHICSGGEDSQVLLYSRGEKRVIRNLSGHTKSVTSVVMHPIEDLILSASVDKTVRLWPGEESATVFKQHSDIVTGVCIQPTNSFFADCSLDNTWCFYDIPTARHIVTVAGDSSYNGMNCLGFQLDGLLLGVGCGDKTVKIYDINTLKCVTSLEGHNGSVESIAFSEDGIHMASASDDGCVKLWDLRKVSCIQSYECGSYVHSLSFDNSGNYLACGSNAMDILKVKTWESVYKNTKDVNGYRSIAWSVDGDYIVAATGDRNIEVLYETN